MNTEFAAMFLSGLLHALWLWFKWSFILAAALIVVAVAITPERKPNVRKGGLRRS